ncbi:hypothetical protein [Aeromicrobium sp. Leaf350]|uniref:hypothetical protein n=1 Tax=Aeromicrobium sp. Leaf350 TaxID=2876565 RepID=UPI001E4391AD|nr:hypothetical protein [Aeromicrobium sp. Leaf350]
MTRAPASVASDVARRLRQRDRSPWVLALGLALAVSLVALAVVSWQWRSDVRTHEAESEARSVAEDRTGQLLTWKAATLDEDAAWADEGATADFRADYDVIIDGLRETYGALGASSTGTVLASSPRATSADEVEVTLFARQSVAQATSGDPTCVLSSIVLTMVRQDDAWLVDALEAPGEPVQVPC